jgi:hypothetical protein
VQVATSACVYTYSSCVADVDFGFDARSALNRERADTGVLVVAAALVVGNEIRCVLLLIIGLKN